MVSLFRSIRERFKSSVAINTSDKAEADPVLYFPLERDQIRLVKLCQSDLVKDEIVLELVIVDLSHVPPFQVLSFVWGDAPRLESVICNNRRVQVLPNVHYALRTISEQLQGQLLWLDYLCINQKNIDENSIQYSLLNRISLAATNTILWVAEAAHDQISTADDLAAAAKKIVTCLFKAQEIVEENIAVSSASTANLEVIRRYRQMVPAATDPAWKGAEALLDRRLFQKSWTIQDVVFSNHLTIQWGTAQFQWTELVRGLQVYSIYANPNMIKNQRVQTILLIEKVRRRRLNGDNITFDHLFEAFRPLTATDHLDSVYSMYSLLTSHYQYSDGQYAEFEVDYSRTVNDVFIKASHEIATSTRSAPYLPLSEAGYNQRAGVRDVGFDLPSWVPDFSLSSEFVIYRLNASDNVFNASKGHIQSSNSVAWEPMTGSRRTVLLRGTIVDKIYQLSCYMPPRRFCDLFNVGGANSFFFSEWHDWVLSSQLTKYKGDKDKLLLDWAETIQAGYNHNETAQQAYTTVEMINRAKRWLDYIENEDLEQTEDIRQFHALCLPSCGRRLAVTKHGRLCLVPRYTEPGDLVYIPQNSKVPFIFRRLGLESLRDMRVDEGYICSNIGECYVHGAMHGEALQWEHAEALNIMLQ